MSAECHWGGNHARAARRRGRTRRSPSWRSTATCARPACTPEALLHACHATVHLSEHEHPAGIGPAASTAVFNRIPLPSTLAASKVPTDHARASGVVVITKEASIPAAATPTALLRWWSARRRPSPGRCGATCAGLRRGSLAEAGKLRVGADEGTQARADRQQFVQAHPAQVTGAAAFQATDRCVHVERFRQRFAGLADGRPVGVAERMRALAVHAQRAHQPLRQHAVEVEATR